jgi:hypothetical protein
MFMLEETAMLTGVIKTATGASGTMVVGIRSRDLKAVIRSETA